MHVVLLADVVLLRADVVFMLTVSVSRSCDRERSDGE
jgi:hypothetical protein